MGKTFYSGGQMCNDCAERIIGSNHKLNQKQHQ